MGVVKNAERSGQFSRGKGFPRLCLDALLDVYRRQAIGWDRLIKKIDDEIRALSVVSIPFQYSTGRLVSGTLPRSVY